ncbi:MAG: hypothetical protein P8Z79_21295 [Sedimentisphaerales bacterium]|jgi:hypothetical protein
MKHNPILAIALVVGVAVRSVLFGQEDRVDKDWNAPPIWAEPDREQASLPLLDLL